jgi:hypothetical protein
VRAFGWLTGQHENSTKKNGKQAKKELAVRLNRTDPKKQSGRLKISFLRFGFPAA